MQTVTLYTKPGYCRMCDMTRDWLKKYGVVFTETVIGETEGDLEAMKSLGLSSAPCVIVSQGEPKDEIAWGGFQPEELKKNIISSYPNPVAQN